MDTAVARAMIGAIREERKRRLDELEGVDPDFRYDRWVFTDEPFIKDMCLTLLVALRHQVERELILIKARTNRGTCIPPKKYRQDVTNEREQLRTEKGWKALAKSLQLDSFPHWNTSMKALQLLANSIKHDPAQEPDEKLLKHIQLPLRPKERMVLAYAPLPESDLFRKGLAKYLKLAPDSDYCTIAETFLDLTDDFLQKVRQKNGPLARIGPISLTEFIG